MILSFADPETELISMGQRSRKLPPDIQDRAFRLLTQMALATDWNDLRQPPGNRLHALHGDLAGRYAIRINRQWHIAFKPEEGLLSDVQIIDYH